MTPELKSTIRTTVQQARKLLIQETAEQLEGIYGIRNDGSREPRENLPGLQQHPEQSLTRQRLEAYLDEEADAGLSPAEAVEKLIRETAFTHLNRLVAFKMMEARKIIRGAVDKGADSNGFKFYLAEHDEELRRYESGQVEEAYRRFLLWQCRQIAEQDHLEVLFDPDNLPSRLFPRPRALQKLLTLLNQETLNHAWQQEETIGWVYQYFIEEDKDAVFEKIYRQKKKMGLRDIPKATQIFTPRWIVQYLVENTLGRLWLRMHPDSRLREKMKYYVLNPHTDNQPLPLKSVQEITLLDPACGTMHFGLVAFDLFYEMYLEELENQEKEKGKGKMVKVEDIPVAIVENNLYGIDIDLRAIQLSALTLYLKVKSRNKTARIRKLNLTYTDIPPIPEGEIDGFVERLDLSHPIAGELLKQILPELNKAYYLGSLLKIEETVQQFIGRKRRELEKQPLAAIAEHGQEAYHNPAEFWSAIKQDILQGLQAAVERQTNGHSLIAGETIQGLGLIDALMKQHDVVVANPPFSGRRNWNTKYASEIKAYYPQNSSDMYAAFIERFKELALPDGFIGFVTSQTFMFTSSYSNLREALIEKSSIQTIMHLGNWSEFDSGGRIEGALAFVAMVLQNKTVEDNRLVCFRHAADKDHLKFVAFQKALSDWQAHGEQATDRHIFVVRQEDFKAIPGWPLVYSVNTSFRRMFDNLPLLNFSSYTRGIQTSDNDRFIRFCWEIPFKFVVKNNDKLNRWRFYTKGGEYNKWYGNFDFLINWDNNGKEIYSKKPKSVVRGPDCFFKEAITFSSLTVSNISFRYVPNGFLFDQSGSAIIPNDYKSLFYLLGILNSSIVNKIIKYIAPTVNFTIGDIIKTPMPPQKTTNLIVANSTQSCIHLKRSQVQQQPFSWEYVAPAEWKKALQERLWKEYRLTVLESEISEMVYRLYEVGEEDIRQIEAEFNPLPTRGKRVKMKDERSKIKESEAELPEAIRKIKKYYLEKHIPEEALKSEEEVAAEEASGNRGKNRRQARYLTFEEVCVASGYHPDTVYRIISEANWERPEERWEVAYNYLEYAIGILMGRFQPGAPGALGSGIIRREDFITGSLTISEEEFAELTRFFPVAYRDESGKHRFPEDVEAQLRRMTDPDGIMVLDEGHPDDVPARVEEALSVMLGEETAQQIIAVLIRESAADRQKFRKFMERDFFSKHHLKMYRKRPIYWLLQTANKNYGFYIFHERIDKDALYKLQRNYIDAKLNWVDQQMKELGRQMGASEGAEYRRLAREQEKLEELYGEIKTFAEKVDHVLHLQDENGRVVGYAPDINDGVILNMAPLHELIPWNEPAKYWKELQAGRYDWAHIAMHYWPNRVLEKCKKDKSLAIAHGVEEN